MAETSVVFKLKGDSKDLDNSLENTSNKAERLAGGIKTAFAVGLATAAAGFAYLTKSAVESFGEYEQLVGGVETLFKDSADEVFKYAQDAYKTAGMSANEYMKTVTNFSASLLQSLGGDTKKASESADMAIKDMSDNANKMGTSIESIQDAYQGFAKQNFTMLDNLKLGYGGTKEEMQRLLLDAEKLSGQKYDISNLNDIFQAIHVVQTEMGITGTTAKEAATTIQGSTAMMKASWQNLMTGLADDTQDFDKLMSNFIESVGTVIQNLLPVLQVVVSQVFVLIQGLLPEIVKTFKTLLPEVVKGISQILKGIIEVLPDIIDAIIEVIPMIVSALLDMLPLLIDVGIEIIISIINGISKMLPKIINKIIEIIPKITEALVKGMPLIIKAGFELLMGLVKAIPDILKKLQPEIPKLVESLTTMMVDNLELMIDASIQLFMALVDAIPIILDILIPMLPDIIEKIVTALIDQLPVLIDGSVKLFMALVEAIPIIVPRLIAALPQILIAIVEGLTKPFDELLKGMWDKLVEIFGDVGGWFKQKFDEAYNFIKNSFSGFGDFFGGLWDGLKNKVNDVWSFIKGLFSDGGEIFNGIVGAVGNIFKDVVNGLIRGINNVISGPIKFINNILNQIRDFKVPGIGKPFAGFWGKNPIPIPQIPYLAKGGIIDKPTVAMVGEAGSEAIVPMKDERMLSRLATKIANAGGDTTNKTFAIETVNLYANDPQDMMNQLNNMAKERGW